MSAQPLSLPIRPSRAPGHFRTPSATMERRNPDLLGARTIAGTRPPRTTPAIECWRLAGLAVYLRRT